MVDGAKFPLLFFTTVMGFLFGAYVMTVYAQVLVVDEPIATIDKWEKFATSSMDTTQIEQTIYIDNKLDDIKKSIDILNDRLWIIEQRR